MKGFRYIIAILFSLLIVFAGAGVAVIHCYCVSCSVMNECCEASHDQKPQGLAGFAQDEECCKAIIYKVDLLKNTEEMPVMAPYVQQLSDMLTELLTPLPVETLQTSSFESPPSPPDARRYLALYSTFII